MKAILFLALFGCAYGALYPESKEGHAPVDSHEPVIHSGKRVAKTHIIPNEKDTLHKGLTGVGKAKQSRAAVPLDVKSSPATQKYIVDTHNDLRRAAGAGDMQQMSWDNELAAKAQAWVDQCTFRHPMTSPSEIATYLKTSKYDQCGQNIAYTSAGSSWENSIKNQWHGEIKDFVYDSNPRNNAVVGHYTQVVWAKTNKVGCGYKKCSFGDYVACNYGPPGNFSPGQYKPFIKSKSGAGCDSCPGKCTSKLCNNLCPSTNAWTNCDELIPDPKTQCSKPDQFGKDKCPATCNCKVQGLLY